MPTIQQLVRNGRVKMEDKSKSPGTGCVSPAPRRMYACVHDDPEEAELGNA